MLNFRNLFLSVAGLWILCSIQNQIHSHRYIHYSSDEQSLYAGHSGHIDHDVSRELPREKKSSPAFALFISPSLDGSRLAISVRAFPLSFSRAHWRSQEYRLFLTGLSPPEHSVQLS